MRGYETPTPPALTRRFARILPKPLRFLACGFVHTVPADYGNCTVCGREWTRKSGRTWLRLHGTRAPRRGQRPETTVHVELLAGVTLHRVPRYGGRHRWTATWKYRGDHRTAHLRPHVDFYYRNVSARARAEAAERARPELVFDDD